jgi:hypothetical protein
MRIARRSATTTLLGAAAGALLSAALVGGPVAHADDIATLPVPIPPLDIDKTFIALSPPGLAGTITYEGGGVNTGNYSVSPYEQAYTTTDGNYTVQATDTIYFPNYRDVAEHVISSNGVAPAEGTTWDSSFFHVPVGLADFYLFEDSHLTTADGTVDVFQSFGYDNIFYQGPDGTLDYLVNGNDPSQFIQLLDLPAAGDTAAAINPADLVGLGDAGSLTTLFTDIQSLF